MHLKKKKDFLSGLLEIQDGGQKEVIRANFKFSSQSESYRCILAII